LKLDFVLEFKAKRLELMLDLGKLVTKVEVVVGTDLHSSWSNQLYSSVHSSSSWIIYWGKKILFTHLSMHKYAIWAMSIQVQI